MFTQAELIPFMVEFADVVTLGEVVFVIEQLDCTETGIVEVDVGISGRLSVFSSSEGSDDPIIALRDSVLPLIYKNM